MSTASRYCSTSTRRKSRRRLVGLFVLLVLLLCCCAAQAATLHDYAEVEVVSTEIMTVQWDAVAGAEYYELRSFHYEKSRYSPTIRTTTTQAATAFSQTGHWRAEVRACRGDGDCSTWAQSTNLENHPFVAGVGERAWRVYARPAPPGEIIIH